MNSNQNNRLTHKMWKVVDILRRDSNVDGIMECIAHIAWLMFLKFLSQEEKKQEAEARTMGKSHIPVFKGDLAWDAWASPEALQKWDLEAGELGTFVRKRLLPALASLDGTPLARTISAIFSDDVSSEKTVRRLPALGGMEGQHIQSNFPIQNSAMELLFFRQLEDSDEREGRSTLRPDTR